MMAGQDPAFLVLTKNNGWLTMAKELSIFIDESGDFGDYDPKSPYYIISMVAHEQNNDISAQIRSLDRVLAETELSRNFVHIGPLIRREAEYKNLTMLERRRILKKMLAFIDKIEFKHASFVVEKKHINTDKELIKRLARQFSDFIKQHYPYFTSFDRIKVYYDNGQDGVMTVIISVFTALFSNADFKKAAQKDYKMLQVTDLICTAKLTEIKLKTHTLSQSERHLLGDDRSIKKNFLRPVQKKEFRN